jgi:modulator of FtsH protease HflC
MQAAAPLPPRPQRQPALRRTLLVLALGVLAWTVSQSFFAVDVTEYALVTRFGKIVHVIGEPGPYLTLPCDKIVRLDKRRISTQPAKAEFLSVDKRNIVVEGMATWRIERPRVFFMKLGTRAAADAQLADALLAEFGAVLGGYPGSALISATASERHYQSIVAEIHRRLAAVASAMYGIEVLDVSILRLSLPEQNRDHVFERMKAERGKMAMAFRSEGELEAKKIVAAADREKSAIETEAYAQAQRLKAEGDAEAARTYQGAFARNLSFYKFLRTLQSYEKFLDGNTTLFLPAEAEVLEMLHSSKHLAIGQPEPRAPIAAPPSAVRNTASK